MRVWIDISNSPQVPFFRPLIALLHARGHDVDVTTREYAQTVELLELYGIAHEVIGPGHGGAGVVGKGRATAGRLRALRGFAKSRDFDIALSHASHELPLVARSLGIPSSYAFDYEFARVQHGLGCRAARRVIVPDAIPQDRLDRLGASERKVRRYPGLKEEYALHGFAPDETVLDDLGLDRESDSRRRSAPLPTCRCTTATGTRCSGTCFGGLAEAMTSIAVVLPRTTRAARRPPGSGSPVAGRARARDRRPEPRRARRSRRIGRRNDEPRGRCTRSSRLHDVCRSARCCRRGPRTPRAAASAHGSRRPRPREARKDAEREDARSGCSSRCSVSGTRGVALVAVRGLGSNVPVKGRGEHEKASEDRTPCARGSSGLGGRCDRCARGSEQQPEGGVQDSAGVDADTSDARRPGRGAADRR